MSELFMELSDEQQELVSGGLVNAANLNAAFFASNTEVVAAEGTALATPAGSGSAGIVAGANQEVLTGSLSLQTVTAA